MSTTGTGAAAQPASSATGAPFRHEIMLVGGAREGDRLPMLVAFHWYGARPEVLRDWLQSFTVPARIILPYGPEPQGNGFAWWPEEGERLRATADVIGTSADAAATLIADLRQRHPTAGRPVVTGLSHGGDISFALAVRHPQLISAAVPIAARMPEELWPRGAEAGAPPIDLFQGADDRIVTMESAIAAVSGLRARGVPIVLHYVPATGHAFPAALQRDVRDQIEARLRAAALTR